MNEKTKNFFAFLFAVITLTALFVMPVSAANSLSAPKSTKIYNIDEGIKIRWSKVSGADSYEIYRVEGTGSKLLGKIQSRSFTDKSVSDGNMYRYKIRAVSGKQNGSFVYLSYRRLVTPKIKSVSFENGSAKITWNSCPNATGYILYKKSSDSKKWVQIASPKKGTLSYTDKNVKNGVYYCYTLRQTNADFMSTYDKTGVGKTYLTAPKNLKVKNSPNGVTLTWSKISGSGKIEIRRKSNGTWKTAATLSTSSTSYIDRGAVYSRKNSYVIRLVASSGQKSANSNTASLYAVNPKKKMVALTYDDGPYRPVTTSILTTLKNNGARATFFVVGSRLSTYSDCLKAEAEQGCEIGCHTYNHTTLTTASDATIKSEISKTNELIKKYTGQTVRLVRAPGGSVNSHVKSVVGYPLINWSVDTRDWSNRSSSVTYSNFKKSVKDGSIVLMHDLYPSTAEATKSIVAYLKQNGYQIVTVPEMMDAKGITMTKGNLYTAA
ncbi:MAG: polysaccharide deacetylase family protein [Acutalibacteraceae bacterium]